MELLCKIGGALLLSRLFGRTGLWYAEPIGWILGLIPSAFHYHWKGGFAAQCEAQERALEVDAV